MVAAAIDSASGKDFSLSSDGLDEGGGGDGAVWLSLYILRWSCKERNATAVTNFALALDGLELSEPACFPFMCRCFRDHAILATNLSGQRTFLCATKTSQSSPHPRFFVLVQDTVVVESS